MGIEAVPIIGSGHRVPGPIRGLKVLENNPGVLVLIGVVTPDVKVSGQRTRPGLSGVLKPGMLVGGVI
jgi:hypothetical protein